MATTPLGSLRHVEDGTHSRPKGVDLGAPVRRRIKYRGDETASIGTKETVVSGKRALCGTRPSGLGRSVDFERASIEPWPHSDWPESRENRP